jgi:hypothetical protein
MMANQRKKGRLGIDPYAHPRFGWGEVGLFQDESRASTSLHAPPFWAE